MYLYRLFITTDFLVMQWAMSSAVVVSTGYDLIFRFQYRKC